MSTNEYFESESFREEVGEALRDEFEYRKARNWDNCGKSFKVHECKAVHDFRTGEADRLKLHKTEDILRKNPLSCDLRICPACAKRHYLRIARKYERFVAKLKNEKLGKRLMFFTLTRQYNYGDTIQKEDLRKLFKDVRKLFNVLYPKKVNKKLAKQYGIRGLPGSGGLAVLEKGTGHNYYHIHCLVWGGYFHNDLISALWLRVTGNSYIVKINEWKGDRKKAIREVCKYTGKLPLTATPDTLVIYMLLLSGIRRVHTFGVFYNAKKIDPSPFVCGFCGSDFIYLGVYNPEQFSELTKAVKLGCYDTS